MTEGSKAPANDVTAAVPASPVPTVSVVMSVYNGMPFVADAVESVLRQPFKDLELIVVDDGSTDGTADALASLRDARLRLVRAPHEGRVAAWNRAVGLARGRYIANLDADDLALPGRLELPVRFLDRHPEVGAVGGASVPYIGDEARARPRRLPRSDAAIRWAFLWRKPMVHSATTYRAAAIGRVGAFDPAYDAFGDDADLLLRIGHDFRLANLDGPLAAKRRHSTQTYRHGAKARGRSRLKVRVCFRAAGELFPPLLRPVVYPVATLAAANAWLEVRMPRPREVLRRVRRAPPRRTVPAGGPLRASLRAGFFEAYPDRLYGAQRCLLDLLRGMPAQGVEPHLFVTAEGPVAAAARASGVRVSVLAPPASLRSYGKVVLRAGPVLRMRSTADVVAYSSRLRGALRAARLDVLHTNNVRGTLLVGWAARSLRLPIVWHHQTERGDQLPLRPYALAYRLADRVVVCAARTGDSLLRRIGRPAPGKVRVVHDGLAELPPVAEPDPRPRIGVVASLEPRKGHATLLRALPTLLEAQPELEVLFAGSSSTDDRYETELRKLADELDVAGAVRFLGHVEDMATFYAGLRVFCLPSDHDAFPRAILEAMAAGLPVVAADVGGIAEAVVPGETGLLVPPGDPAALAAALRSVLADPERGRRMGQAGRARVGEEFTQRATDEGVATQLRAAAARRRHGRSRPPA